MVTIGMNRTVLVTGASSGIGAAIAYAFAEQGDLLVLVGRSLERLQKAKDDILKQYPGAVIKVYELDVRDQKRAKQVCQTILEDVKKIDVLINNAGLALGLEPFQDYDLDDVDTMIDTNIKGILYVTRQILPSMLERNEGHIINMGSTAGIYAYAGAAVYSATKAAVKTLSDGIRIDTIASDIKVTTVQPGIVETNFSKVRFHGDEEKAHQVYEGIEALKTEDIADCILFATLQPRRVQISDLTIMANQQATGFTIHRN